MKRRLIPVSVLVNYLKGQIEDNPVLHGVWVEGEISNLRRPYSGHWYFSLKDEQASLPCVMFRYQASAITFTPKDGDKVMLTGDVTVYEKEGRMQLRAMTMKPSGMGDLYLQLQALTKKLREEGLFDESHKKPLPPYPMSFGIVTGNDTAAKQDIYRTFLNRWPCAQLTDYPAPVQGASAAPKIIEALKKADEAGHDVILLVRGGGSLEDLWCFNDENLVRFIYQMKTPIVTGVGHETDTTLVDFVADEKANTPTGAVEKAAPDYHEVEVRLQNASRHMEHAARTQLERWKDSYAFLSSRPCFTSPTKLYEDKAMRLDTYREKLLNISRLSLTERNRLSEYTHAMTQIMRDEISSCRTMLNQKTASLQFSAEKTKLREENRLQNLKAELNDSVQLEKERKKTALGHTIALLDAYSPLKVMARGYSVVSKNGHTVNDIHMLSVQDEVSLRFSNGTAEAVITKTEGKEERDGGKEKDI